MPASVDIHIESPARFDRLQILVRLVLSIALGFLGLTTGWITCALYLVLPAVAAFFISSRGPVRYLAEVGPSLARMMAWLVGLHAYLLMVIDRPEVGRESADLRMEVHPAGHPTVQVAILRLFTSLPAALLLAVLLVPATLFALVGVVTVLVAETQAEPLLRFQRAVVSYAGRLAAYHAALVDTYPSFRLEPAGPGAMDLAAGAR